MKLQQKSTRKIFLHCSSNAFSSHVSRVDVPSAIPSPTALPIITSISVSVSIVITHRIIVAIVLRISLRRVVHLVIVGHRRDAVLLPVVAIRHRHVTQLAVFLFFTKIGLFSQQSGEFNGQNDGDDAQHAVGAETEEIPVNRVDHAAAGNADDGLHKVPRVIARRHFGAQTDQDFGNGVVDDGGQRRLETIDGVADEGEDGRG